MKRKLHCLFAMTGKSGKERKSFYFLLLYFLLTSQVFAQEKSIGTVDGLYGLLKTKSSGNARLEKVFLSATDRELELKINVDIVQNKTQLIIGAVAGSPVSTVSLRFTQGKVEGKAILASEKKAYEYYTESGKVYVKEVDIHKVICVDYAKPPAEPALNAVQAIPPPNSSVYHLQSFPSASATVKLDFDGEYVVNSEWNGGLPIDAPPINFSEAEITEIWNYISEDFRAFNVNITTDEAVYLAAPINTRQRVIFTTNTVAAPTSGGVAHFNSFVKGSEIPCWVYMGGTKAASEAGSHEIGHTLGLSHDGRDVPGQAHVEYYEGQGVWAPIMGVGYYRDFVQWSQGEYNYSNNPEDDIQVIAGGSNGFTFRADEAGGTVLTASQLVYTASGTVSAASNGGVIANRSDVDAFYFTTTGGNVTFTVNPTSAQSNLDILLTLKNSSGTTIATANPSTTYGATIAVNLTAGKYYLHVDGTGSGDPATTGYSDFSSIGGYAISGSFPANSYNPAPTVAFTFPHPLDTLVTGATVNLTAAASDNGAIAKVDFYEGDVLLLTDNQAPYSIIYTPASGQHDLRVVATDNLGAVTTASLSVFARRATIIATVYHDCDYVTSGYAVNLYEGAYRLAQLEALGVKNDDISSLKILPGYEIVLFRDENFVGPSYTFSSDRSCLVSDNVNDWASSLIIRQVSNTLPVIAITSPSNGQSFDTGSNIVFSAAASDPDGTVAKVDFYNGSTLLFSDNSVPYSYTIPNAATGSYSLKATVVDNSGNSASATINISVVLPPTTAGISGPGCVSPGQTYTYLLNPGPATPTGVNWWASSGSIQVDAVNRRKAYFTAAQGTSSIVIHAGANFSGAPYYQQFLLTIASGGCSGAASPGEEVPSLTILNPFSIETFIAAGPGDKINNVKVYDAQGVMVDAYTGLGKESILFGSNLQSGIYMIYIESNRSIFKRTLLKQ